METFLKWLNAERSATYLIACRPDESERQAPEIDYVLRSSGFQSEIALEISSLWRSSDAGREDNFWSFFTERVAELLRGGLPGTFHAVTDLRITPELDAQAFADELGRQIVRYDDDLAALSESGRFLTFRVCGMEVSVDKGGNKASEVSFGRRGGIPTY